MDQNLLQQGRFIVQGETIKSKGERIKRKILIAWKDKALSMKEFEELWEQNNRYEVARSYISLLKEVESISLEEKLKFLNRLIDVIKSRILDSEKDREQKKT